MSHLLKTKNKKTCGLSTGKYSASFKGEPFVHMTACNITMHVNVSKETKMVFVTLIEWIQKVSTMVVANIENVPFSVKY